MTRSEDWPTSGNRLVARILIRRRLRCIREGKHTIGYCRSCGVDTSGNSRVLVKAGVGIPTGR